MISRVPVPGWLQRRWERELERSGRSVVSSPHNANGVAIYGLQSVLGAAHLAGLTSPTSFLTTFGEHFLTPWALLYVLAGLLGLYAVVMRRTSCRSMAWARPELLACISLGVSNALYLWALVYSSGVQMPLITVIMCAALGAAAVSRAGQVWYELVKMTWVARTTMEQAKDRRAE